MLELAYLLHQSSIGFIITATSFGVGVSAGKASKVALEALDMQPQSHADIIKLSTLGLALIETAGIIGIIITFMIIGTAPSESLDLFSAIAKCGIAAAIGIAGMVASLSSAGPVAEACIAVARQPFFSQKILNLLLLTLSIIQTPVIFGFLIGLLIKTQLAGLEDFNNSIRLLASGLCIGLGSIGPSIGLARFAQAACEAVGINRKSYNQVLPFTFISEAIIETPLIFAFVTATVLVSTQLETDTSPLIMIACLSAAFCIGIGTLSPSINSSRTASAACRQIARTPSHYSIISRASMVSQALIDAAAVYALLISLMLIMFK